MIMKINNTKFRIILLLLFCIFCIGNISASYPSDFIIEITESHNTALQAINTSFGDVIPGSNFSENIINASFSLTNSGNIATSVSAKFTTSYNTTYGLVNGTSVISASNFKVGNSTLDVLLDNGSPITLTNNVPADNTPFNYEVQLRVPPSQTALGYLGTVQFTFSNTQS